MHNRILQVHPSDNVLVALRDLAAGEAVAWAGETYTVLEPIPIKHKFATRDFRPGDLLTMYGVTVGRAVRPIHRGMRITVDNVEHAAASYEVADRSYTWTPPPISAFAERTFQGYHRADGRVGTRNYWLVIPLVFCENRNIRVIQEALSAQLGYATDREFSVDVPALIERYRNGATTDELLATPVLREGAALRRDRLFPNVDGIRFLTHEGGCGGTRQDAAALCHLLAGYIDHPNVAGATVLSLGCQNAQIALLEAALRERDPQHNKPVYILEQQQSASEREFIAAAVKQTFVGLVAANTIERRPAPLSALCLGLECGGSDGFSGLSANPALGHTTDLLVALGGRAILSEFPELNGVEQELINRCTTAAAAQKFTELMGAYARQAEATGSSFAMNPSPGNIRDGLITDAMKSAGAAKKGGTSPVVGVLDYTEPATEPGLHLLCTPGNDVESTTGLAGSGANLIVFTTGLGTPTGNPVAPTVKMATNSDLAARMADLIDIDAGTIITGADTIESKGTELLELLIAVASGEQLTCAERLGQHDFIPWKRGVSL
jgi:altronate hydrolase